MSNYNESADKAEKQLSRISPTMCYAKWLQSSMHLTNGMTHSCYHPPLHKINIDALATNPSALHNTDQKKSERKLMLKGERPSGCSYCWKIEDVGGRSDRIYRSGEYWAQNGRQDIFEELDQGNVTPRYLEVNFNQACNFKCMYCSPHLSTAWEDEINQFGPYEILDNSGNNARHNDTTYLEKDGFMPLKVRQDANPYLEAFWKWWPQLYKKLEVFRITGGEPLMDVNTFKVLDYIYKNPNTWLELSITSNFCPPKEELMDKFIDKLKKLEQIQIWEDKERWNPGSGNNWYVNMAVKNFALFVSVDSVGEQAEYIRSGLKFDTMKKNVLRFLNETHNTTVTFINTFNILSVPKIKDYLKYILDLRTEFSRENQGTKYIPIYDPNYTHPDYLIHPRQRIWFDVPVLRSPAWQSIQILPKEYDIYLEDAIEFMKQHRDTGNFDGFYDFEIDKLERNLALMQERNSLEENKLNIDRKNFYLYFTQYDQRKELNFLKTFPELKKFNKLCKSI
jgi:organic radical activating enzyme